MRVPRVESDHRPVALQVERHRQRGAPLSLIGADVAPPRCLVIDDVYELLRGSKSKWWIRTKFAPEHRLKIGRTVAWLESDVHSWIETLRAPR